MSAKEIFDKLGIESNDIIKDGDVYVADITSDKDMDEDLGDDGESADEKYGKIISKLNKDEDMEYLDSASSMDEHSSVQTYEYKGKSIVQAVLNFDDPEQSFVTTFDIEKHNDDGPVDDEILFDYDDEEEEELDDEENSKGY